VKFLLMLSADTSHDRGNRLPGCAEWSKEMTEHGVPLDTIGLRPPTTPPATKEAP
jgi:hypothetical protein